MRLPNLSGIPPNPVPVHKLTTKEGMKELIWKNHGVITLVCLELNISYTQFWRAVHKWGLDDELRAAKQMFVEKAQETLFNALESKSESTRITAASTILRYSTPRQTQEITVKNGDTETTIKNIFGIGGD